MLDKMKDKFAADAQRTLDRQVMIRDLFADNVENADGYVVGVAQIERPKPGIAGILANIFANTKLLVWTDYILAANTTTNDIVALELADDNVVKTIEFKSDESKSKKESKLVDELVGGRADRLGRERFVFTNNDDKFKFLVGKYSQHDTNFEYDNQELIKALKTVVKNKK